MMVNRAECENCGESVDYIVKDMPLSCGHCGDDLEFVGKVGCVTGVASVPYDDIRELVEAFRQRGDDMVGEDGDQHAYYECADRLGGLIPDE